MRVIFDSPWWFLALIPLGVWYYYVFYRQKSGNRSVASSNWGGFTSARTAAMPFLAQLPWIAAFLGVLAMTKPQHVFVEENSNANVVDIMLTMDLSSSMLAMDFEPNRLEVSKKVASEFVDERKFDRIGLVTFSGEAFTQCPATTDHSILKEFLRNLECGLLEEGTAIGLGLATAVNRLKSSDVRSKIIILLTDGENNAGDIPPMEAAALAKSLNVKVYTVGVGSEGFANTPINKLDGQYVFGVVPVRIDEDLLNSIAETTGGKYYRATDLSKLREVYAEISRLERSKVQVTSIRHTKELFHYLLIPALALLCLFILLRTTWLNGVG